MKLDMQSITESLSSRIAFTGVRRLPKGYASEEFPRLVGNADEEQCTYCFCHPCVIALPPHFLTGRAEAALGNISKRFALYHKFWQLLGDLGVWKCEMYLEWKSTRKSRDDCGERIPECIVTVRQYTIS